MLLMLQTEWYQQKLFFRFWQAVGLPVQSDKIAAAARRRIRFGTSAMFVGELAGLFLVALALFFRPSLASVSFIWLFVLPAVMTAMTTLDVGVALHYSLFRRRDITPADVPNGDKNDGGWVPLVRTTWQESGIVWHVTKSVTRLWSSDKLPTSDN